MASLAQAKTLGGVGSLLVLLSFVPTVGAIIAIIGLIMTLIAVKYISDSLHDASIFNNILIAIILAIVGVVIGGLVVIGTVFRFIGLQNITPGTTPVPSNVFGMVAGIIGGLAVVWIMFIVAAFFQRRSYDVIATRLNIGTFRTAALLYLIGAALVIVLIGFVLLFVAQILFIVAFFSISEGAIAAQPGPAPMPPLGPSAQAGKFCVKCGASLPRDSTYCPSCGASQPPVT